jgi:hypothetical protein
MIPHITWFRHANVNPHESGSLQSDTINIVATTEIEG